jgi:hypothetical protein
MPALAKLSDSMVHTFEDHRHHLEGYHLVFHFRRRPLSLAEDQLLSFGKYRVTANHNAIVPIHKDR